MCTGYGPGHRMPGRSRNSHTAGRPRQTRPSAPPVRPPSTLSGVARQCSRTGCSEAATVTLTYQYSLAQVWLDGLAADRDPHAYDLCHRHADRLTAPQGWHVRDRRHGTRRRTRRRSSPRRRTSPDGPSTASLTADTLDVVVDVATKGSPIARRHDPDRPRDRHVGGRLGSRDGAHRARHPRRLRRRR